MEVNKILPISSLNYDVNIDAPEKTESLVKTLAESEQRSENNSTQTNSVVETITIGCKTKRTETIKYFDKDGNLIKETVIETIEYVTTYPTVSPYTNAPILTPIVTC